MAPMTMLEMPAQLSVPTMYTPVVVEADQDPMPTARAMAEEGADPGTLVWAAREDCVDCAVVLGPELPAREALLVSYVVMAGIGDALGALLPPGIAVAFGWPDRILVNGGTAGGIRVMLPDSSVNEAAMDAVPEWMVVGLTVAVKSDRSEDPSPGPNRTTLEEEGGGDVGAVALLESFTRHFLYWIDRWLDEGFGPIKTGWLSRAAGYGPNTGMEIDGTWSQRKLLWLQDDGSIRYAEDSKEHSADLAHSLGRPTWSR